MPVIAIDHHIGAKEEMEALAAQNPLFTFVFDVERSGSSLSWEYFFPNERMPRLIALIEDGDLWRFKYGDDTRHLGTFMMTRANQPESILPLFDAPIESVLAEGKAMSALADAMMAQFKSFAKPVWVTLDGHTVPLYNNPHFDSRLGNDMSELHDCVSGVFDIRGDMVRLSFRSKDHHSPNALAIAKTLGGGGHPNAAGTQMPLPQFIACMNIK